MIVNPIARAMAGTAQGNAADAVRQRRVGDDRNYVRELQANELYEELRHVPLPELRRRAGREEMCPLPRGVLIAEVIERETRDTI